jgi:hypothetical protein
LGSIREETKHHLQKNKKYRLLLESILQEDNKKIPRRISTFLSIAYQLSSQLEEIRVDLDLLAVIEQGHLAMQALDPKMRVRAYQLLDTRMQLLQNIEMDAESLQWLHTEEPLIVDTE